MADNHYSRSPIDHVCSLIFRSPTDPTTLKLKSCFERFLDSDDIFESQGFSILHRIVLGLTKMNLKTYLEYSTSGINSKCAKGWTSLFWAVVISDIEAVGKRNFQDSFSGRFQSAPETISAL